MNVNAMKRLLIIIVFSGSGLAFPSGEVRILIEDTKKPLTSCKAYENHLQVITELDDSGEKFKQAASFKKVLESFRVSPQGATAYHRLISYVSSNLSRLDDDDIAAVIYEAQSCGSVVAEFKAIKGLLGTVKNMEHARDDQAKVVRLALEYIKHGAKTPGTLIQHMVQITLLKKLSDERFLNLDEDQRAVVSALWKKGNSIKDRLRSEKEPQPAVATMEMFNKLDHKSQREIIKKFKTEVALTGTLRMELVKVLDKIKIS